MSRVLLPLCALGILLLANCTKENPILVQSVSGERVGIISIQDSENAEIFDMQEQSMGKVRGNIVRDATRKRVGSVTVSGDQVQISTVNGNEVGALEDGRDCIDENGNLKGRISQRVDTEAAAGACLLFFVF